MQDDLDQQDPTVQWVFMAGKDGLTHLFSFGLFWLLYLDITQLILYLRKVHSEMTLSGWQDVKSSY